MRRYATMIFDVGGTLLRFDLDKLARAYVERAAAVGLTLDLQHARTVLEALELELPARSRERQISLELENGRGFWNEFYAEGFRRMGVERDMSGAASDIREHFQRGEFETVYADVVPALEALAAQGVHLGILSNFSANCEDVLRLAQVHRYFSFFVVSALAGVEKPNPRIFDIAVKASGRARDEIVYIGDSLYHDVEGARQAGLAAILVDRNNRYPDYAGLEINDLRELAEFAGKEFNADPT